MNQHIGIGISATTGGAERNISKVKSAATDLAESLGDVADSGKKVAAGISATCAIDALKRVGRARRLLKSHGLNNSPIASRTYRRSCPKIAIVDRPALRRDWLGR
jgi:hypothetical protein